MKKDFDEIETINIELEHRVTRLIAKNEHLKQTYKQLYDSIKPSSVRAKEQYESLVNKVNQKKDIVDNATTMALGMYNIDPIILAPKVKNNREAHEYYLKHTIKQAAILRELLGYVRDTCPDIHKPSKKLVAATPINKKKIVRFADTVRSSGNIPKVTNRPLLSFTGVNPSTSSSGSKPSGNTKNDRIPRTPSAKALSSVCNECLFDANHAMYLIDHVNSMNKPTGRTFTLVGNTRPLTRLTATNKVPLRVPIPIEVGAPKHVVTKVYTRRPKVPKSVQNSKPKVLKSMTVNRMEPGTSRGSDTSFALSFSSLIDCSIVKFDNDQVVKIIMYGDYQIRNVTISRVYYVEGLGHNLFLVGQFCDSDLEDHLYSACDMGKSKKQSHKPKSEDTNQEKLYLLHMDLCGPMRVASVNRNKYILVIVDDYSQFTWVKFLASKDEALDFIIKILIIIQVTLNATLRELYKKMVLLRAESVLLLKPLEQSPFVPPSRHEWDLVFQQVFDEFFSPPASVASLEPVEEAPPLVESTGSPSLTTINQDAPSP
nr:integrase, catalytic region, zinc finger, CCHC-type, peptidase aspartic, catalytic [Tanacetum cinerariifolium]